MTELSEEKFRKRLKKYFQETPLAQITKDAKAAKPIKVPDQWPQEGFEHTGSYLPPEKGDWYQSHGQKIPKLIRGQDKAYGRDQCRWLLRKLKEDDEPSR